MTKTLYGKGAYFNPFQFNDNGKEKEVSNIYIYGSDGNILYQTNWFHEKPFDSNRGNVDNIELKNEILRRLKPKFDGKTFYVPSKASFMTKNRVDLYIPFLDVDVVEAEKSKLDWGTRTADRVAYAVKFPTSDQVMYLTQSENERQTFNNVKNEEIQEIIKKSPLADKQYAIEHHFEKIKQMVEEIEAVKKKRMRV